ncbi:MAG TPA: hypothetical protein VFT99_17830, partial [Roseiflexaceae bacterium]|nr:hypothetical protein [Roseiflexaceae bacterium]
VRGWTPDGRILFASTRDSITPRVSRLFTIAREGGLPDALPMLSAERGSFSPDGKRLAYTPFADPFWSWKRYRGGTTVPIWVIDLETYEHIEIPHLNASDTFPCWIDGAIAFLSDRHGTMNVFRYDLADGSVTQLTHHTDFDVRSLTSNGRSLAYEQGGRIHLYDLSEQRTETLHLTLAADLPYTRPHYEKLAPTIQTAAISPTGVRAVFETRGEIVTVPAGKGDIRNLTNTPGVADRDPAWSPDGRSIAYFSDASGEYELVVADQKGIEKQTYPLGRRSFFHAPTWSPDGKRIAFTDKALNLSYITLATGEVVHVDTDTYDHPDRSLHPAWSPDSAWLVYTRRLRNHLRAVFLYELEGGRIHQVSDGMSDAVSACFSRDGRLIYFAASVNYGLNTGWLDMSSYERPVNRSLYAVVLRADDPSPLAPESDEEAHAPLPGEEPHTEAPATPAPPVEVRIDLEGLDQRIVALPVPPGDYSRLQVAEGKLFYLKSAPDRWVDAETSSDSHTLLFYDVKERKSTPFTEKVANYWVSADGKKVLFQAGTPPRYAIVDAAKAPEADEGVLKLDEATILVDPRAEWRQIFDEAYRIQRDYFYDAAMHGLDWQATVEIYRAFLPHVGHRD